MRAFRFLILVFALAALATSAAASEPEPEATATSDKVADVADAAKVEATPEEANPKPKLHILTPSASWIRVDQPSAAGEETVAMLLHARGQGRVFVRKYTPKTAKKATLNWLNKEMRDVEIFETEESDVESATKPDHEEFSFVGWQGAKAMAGIAGIYIVGKDAYVVLAACDQNFYEEHHRELQKVLAEFRAE